MSDPIAATHPRELYTMLRACSSDTVRAEKTLEFLCSCAGATGGYLFQLRDGQPALAAGSHDRAPGADLVAEVTRMCLCELDAAAEERATETLDASLLAAQFGAAKQGWEGADGKRFHIRMLSTYRDRRWAPMGLIALRADNERPLAAFRQAHIEALCNAFLDPRPGPNPP
jgi:hypothetical protein